MFAHVFTSDPKLCPLSSDPLSHVRAILCADYLVKQTAPVWTLRVFTNTTAIVIRPRGKEVQGHPTNHYYASDHTSALTLNHLEARAFMLWSKLLRGRQSESTIRPELRFRALLTRGGAERLELARA